MPFAIKSASFLAAIFLANLAGAQESDCAIGEVSFETAGVEQTLVLRIHERRIEVPMGLFGITELPQFGGVLSIYPEPRNSRSLANSDALAADLMSFSANGIVIQFMIDKTGTDVDRMPSGDGMLYAAYLAGGTIEAMGFDNSTKLTEWLCIEEG